MGGGEAETSRRMHPPIEVTDNPRPAVFEVDAINELGSVVVTPIAGEHPLTLYLDKRELVTLMTLGAAPEHLALGYLRNQRIIASIAEIAAVQVDWDTDSVAITSRVLRDTGSTLWEAESATAELESRLARRTVTTGCGQGSMFGDLMDALDDVSLPAHARLTEEVLYTVMARLRGHESIYRVAGAVHGCALCSNAGEDRGEIVRFVEDVGRHNAVDAIAGWMWLEQVGGADKIFYTTGRLTSEMVIKAAQMGIPFLVSRSGLTRMGYEIAQRVGLTIIGRCQGRHYLLFTGTQRFVRAPGTALA